MENRLKPPIYKNGILFCPYCRSPLLTIEETHFKFKCAVCQKPLGKLTITTLKKMFDDFPKELAKEWMLEMEARKNLAATNFNHSKIC
ncbi:MAG: hypothetical protein QHH12_02780 [Candidatus Bathyarchaeota archaeon]|jgi:uncharacterized protein YbaR (Trm112 family)|nr:hypothetical protein [Candidatus Bathyarchaeota archaeon A05DMB-3]MDH7606681.1 hypothetical protein [Candidatus Bathyarchaeota archaeon]